MDWRKLQKLPRDYFLVLEFEGFKWWGGGFQQEPSQGVRLHRFISLPEEFGKSAKESMGGSRGVRDEVSGNSGLKPWRTGDAI